MRFAFSKKQKIQNLLADTNYPDNYCTALNAVIFLRTSR